MRRAEQSERALIARTPLPDPPSEVSGSDESGVLAALRRLPARQQSVVVLTVLEGYTERVTAQTLGIPVGR
ncbi:MAG: sigma factor-like helix-turn-helix DNA-binding protein [Microbacterium sp.]